MMAVARTPDEPQKSFGRFARNRPTHTGQRHDAGAAVTNVMAEAAAKSILSQFDSLSPEVAQAVAAYAAAKSSLGAAGDTALDDFLASRDPELRKLLTATAPDGAATTTVGSVESAPQANEAAPSTGVSQESIEHAVAQLRTATGEAFNDATVVELMRIAPPGANSIATASGSRGSIYLGFLDARGEALGDDCVRYTGDGVNKVQPEWVEWFDPDSTRMDVAKLPAASAKPDNSSRSTGRRGGRSAGLNDILARHRAQGDGTGGRRTQRPSRRNDPAADISIEMAQAAGTSLSSKFGHLPPTIAEAAKAYQSVKEQLVVQGDQAFDRYLQAADPELFRILTTAEASAGPTEAVGNIDEGIQSPGIAPEQVRTALAQLVGASGRAVDEDLVEKLVSIAPTDAEFLATLKGKTYGFLNAAREHVGNGYVQIKLVQDDAKPGRFKLGNEIRSGSVPGLSRSYGRKLVAVAPQAAPSATQGDAAVAGSEASADIGQTPPSSGIAPARVRQALSQLVEGNGGAVDEEFVQKLVSVAPADAEFLASVPVGKKGKAYGFLNAAQEHIGSGYIQTSFVLDHINPGKITSKSEVLPGSFPGLSRAFNRKAVPVPADGASATQAATVDTSAWSRDPEVLEAIYSALGHGAKIRSQNFQLTNIEDRGDETVSATFEVVNFYSREVQWQREVILNDKGELLSAEPAPQPRRSERRYGALRSK